MKTLTMPKSLSFLTKEGIDKNFSFLVIEVTKQVEACKRVIDSPTPRNIQKVTSRDDYIDNLKSVIGHKCFTFHLERDLRKKEIDVIRAIDVMTNNLERIADHAVNVAGQTRYLKDTAFMQQFPFGEMFLQVFSGLKLLPTAVEKMDLNIALEICKCEFTLDTLFKKEFQNIIESLKTGENTENLITALFILRYIERMGDCLLNIGESLISAVLGQKLKIADYKALESSLQAQGNGDTMENMTFEAFTETKSGCRIKRVKRKDHDIQDRGAIFKDGNPEKILREKEMIEAWDAIQPGLPPRIFSYKSHEEYASILLEFLDGTTLQQLVIDARTDMINDAMAVLKKTVSRTWEKTMESKPSNPNFMNQLKNRIEDIYTIHPEFRSSAKQINSLHMVSYGDLLNIAEEIEVGLSCPFTVFIHGDFNVDNVLYNTKDGNLHFIDFNRSKHQDYVQDVSVFLISNFRLPIFVPKIRNSINQVNVTFYEFARSFAELHDDRTFHARLTLGLARSFMTSTRFEFNRNFAATLYQRSFYLLEKLNNHRGKPWEEFPFPLDVLSY